MSRIIRVDVVTQMQTYAEENDLGFRVTPFKRVLQVHEGNPSQLLYER